MSIQLFDAVHADPWAEDCPDLPSLNAQASDAIETAALGLREIATTSPETLRSKSIVVLGPPGAGKTHLFARLRRRLGPRAVFVHVRPLVGSELTPRLLLSEITRQLGYTSRGLRQADALVGSLLAHLNGSGSGFPRAFLEEYQRLDDQQRTERLEEALEKVLARWPEADESTLRKLLALPFVAPAKQRALLAWLSGQECDAVQLTRAGAAGAMSEEMVMPALRTLSAVAALGAPLVLVFDQLENLVEIPGPGARLLAYAHLTSELVDSLRGLVLVHLALDTEWARGIEPSLNLAQRSRLVMQRELLQLPSRKQKEDLLRLWSERLPDPEAPFPWPFGEQRVARWVEQTGMTPRMLLLECRRALDGSLEDAEQQPRRESDSGHENDLSAVRSALQKEWHDELATARRSLDEGAQLGRCLPPERLADGFLAAARFVPELEVTLGRMTDAAQLSVRGPQGTLSVALLHHAHHKSLGSTLAKLVTQTDMQPVLAIRELAFDLPPTWKDTLRKRQALLGTGRARWFPLERESAAQLLALAGLLQSARSGDISDDHGRSVPDPVVADWVSSELGVATWSPIQALQATTSEEEEDEQPLVDLAAPPPEPSHGSAAHSSAHSETPPSGPALPLLMHLRVTSLDRLVREVQRVEPGATRASVLRELEANAHRVQLFARSLVCARGET